MGVDILAFGAHPDDIELGCSGSIALSISQGKTVAAIDLTRGELGTRGNAETRDREAKEAAVILGLQVRENLDFRDGFFTNDEMHQKAVIQKVRFYQPEIVFCNALRDRHIDHAKANQLVNDACFLSGLSKIETQDENGRIQKAWRPKVVLEYIQWNDITPHIVVDISSFLSTKIKAVTAYSSQDRKSTV